MGHRKLAPDINGQRPHFNVRLDKVGITKLKHQISIRTNRRPIVIPAEFKVWAELPNNYRAVHMSRNLEALREILFDEESKSFIEHDYYNICPQVASKLLSLQEYTNKTYVSMEFDLFLERFSPERKYTNREPYRIRLGSLATRTNKQVELSHCLEVIVEGTTTCPCAQNESKFRYLESFSGQGIELSKEVIDSCIFPTHMQRAIITIRLDKLSKVANIVEHLIDLGENSLSNGTQGLLKRDDEEALIRQAFLNPKFVEDVVRDAAYGLTMFPVSLSPKTDVYISVETQESIHKHNAYAELYATIEELSNFSQVELLA